MYIDPYQEWVRLTQEYRAMSDEELRDLNRDFADLTEVARQVLSAEMQSRGLDKKIAEEQQIAASNDRPWTKREVSPFVGRAEVAAQGGLLGSIVGSNATEPVPDDEESNSESDEPVEYTWKTMLCEGMEYDQAWQIFEVLRRAGIESWIERPGGRRASRVPDQFDGDLRVLVAADELDRARDLIANPIPQDIVDASHQTLPDYEPPCCPACGAEDPVLESAEPVNAWKCESCGREWTDPGGESDPAGSLT
jgi:hypothetical protein